jgi:hypothetical protein
MNELIATALILLCSPENRPSVAAEGFYAATFEKEMARLEALWKAGKRVEYFLEAENAVERFGEGGDEVRDDQERARCGVRPLEIMLARKLRVGDFLDYCLADNRGDFLSSSTCDLSAMCQFACWIAPRIVYADDNTQLPVVPAESRVTNLMLVADVLGRFRGEIVTDYRDGVHDLDVVFPVETGNGLGYSGMNPEEMGSRVARAAARAVARENLAARILNPRQHWLRGRTPGSYCARRLFDAIVYVLHERKDRSALLAECAIRARLTGEEVKGIRERLEAEDRRKPDPP